jgi:DNA-binding CsgD family transcriptional regulator
MKPITIQEQKILTLIGQGYSTSQIAYAYGISAHTVDSHRRNLLTKFDAKNSAELILKAVQAKILRVNNLDQKENLNPTQDESDL